MNPDNIKTYLEECGVCRRLHGLFSEEIWGIIIGKSQTHMTQKHLERNVNWIARFTESFDGKKVRMNYRDRVGVHQERIYQFVLLFRDEFEKLGIDTRKLLFLLRFHDTPEGFSLLGDISTLIKIGLSDESREVHEEYELAIIKILARDIITENREGLSSDEIEEVLRSGMTKNDIYGQLLFYFDKLDGMLVSFHELMSGNTEHFERIFGNYLKLISEMRDDSKFGELHNFTRQIPNTSPLYTVFSRQGIQELETARRGPNISLRENFTEDDVSRDFGSTFYGLWKEATLNIQSFPVGNQVMTGKEILISPRD